MISGVIWGMYRKIINIAIDNVSALYGSVNNSEQTIDRSFRDRSETSEQRWVTTFYDIVQWGAKREVMFTFSKKKQFFLTRSINIPLNLH